MRCLLRLKISVFCLIIATFVFSPPAAAAVNPLANANNFIGIHILFPEELETASKLVNSSGGKWGYVTIPIQIGERNLERWQRFLDEARRLQIIPIVRLATEPHYKNTAVWRKPTEYDILDFTNFLNSLNWPTKNKYVILFNEVNRFDEWGGQPPQPEEFADLVDFAVDTFKRRDENFFLILGALDASAPNNGTEYINSFEFLRRMAQDKSEIFKKIDGFASHSYPNPDYASSPDPRKKIGVATYRFEYEFVRSLTQDSKPIFITETGWNGDRLDQNTISSYFKLALEQIWKQDSDKIVAITPFLLKSAGGPFDKFSFFKNGAETEYFKAVERFPKVQGEPELTVIKKASESAKQVLAARAFRISSKKKTSFSPILTYYFQTIFGIR